MAFVTSDLATFWANKEKELGRTISIYEVAKDQGIAWETVKNLKNGETSRFDSNIIGKVCAFFGVPDGAPVPFLKVHYNGS
ncbi:MAG: helix-turn-helix transcriptional regulator [Dehalococcoidales bacterium]